jgi:urease accessory protein
MKRSLAKLAVFLLIASPLAALAHTGHGGGFSDGFVHPFSGIDHLLLILTVGVWSVVHVAGRAWRAPTGFVVCLAIGCMLGQQGWALPQIELVLAASVIVVGLMLAGPRKLSVVASPALFGGFALVHGIAHGSELAAGAGVVSGIVLGSAVLLAAGMGLAHALFRNRPRLVRRSGQLVALLGGGLAFATIFA